MCGDDGDAGLVGVSEVGVKLIRYVISRLSTLRINDVGKVTHANGRNGGIGYFKTPDA